MPSGSAVQTNTVGLFVMRERAAQMLVPATEQNAEKTDFFTEFRFVSVISQTPYILKNHIHFFFLPISFLIVSKKMNIFANKERRKRHSAN
jgi:hypothetical protein